MKKVTLGDGRQGTIEAISQNGLLWIRDERGNLHSCDPKTGWSSDGNWKNDLKRDESKGDK